MTFVDNSIMMEYDSAFAQLKSKKLLDQLVSLAQDPYLFSFFPQTMKMLARWRDPSMEKVIMGYFANPGLVKTQIAMSLGRSADDASILQREYSRWDSHGQYTVIICLRYYPSIQVLDKLTQFEALTVEDMKKSLSKCCTRNDRIWIKDIRSLLLDLKAQGKTILLASHFAQDIDELCDTVHEMDQGIITMAK